MQSRITLICLFIFCIQFGFAQTQKFSIELSGSYGLYSKKVVEEIPDELPYNPSALQILFNPHPFENLKLKTEGKLGFGLIGKMKLKEKEESNWRVGIGVEYLAFDIKSANGAFWGPYYFESESNKLLYLTLIPVEWRKSIFANKKMSVFANASLQILAWSSTTVFSSTNAFNGESSIESGSSALFKNLMWSASVGGSYAINQKFSIFTAYQRGITSLYFRGLRNFKVMQNLMSFGISYSF